MVTLLSDDCQGFLSMHGDSLMMMTDNSVDSGDPYYSLMVLKTLATLIIL